METPYGWVMQAVNPNEQPRTVYVPVALLGFSSTDHGQQQGQMNQPPSHDKDHATHKSPKGIKALSQNLFTNLKTKYHAGLSLPANPAYAGSSQLPQQPQPPSFQPPQQPALFSTQNPPFVQPTAPLQWSHGYPSMPMNISASQFFGGYPPSMPYHLTAPNTQQPENQGYQNLGHQTFTPFSAWQYPGGHPPIFQGPGPTLPPSQQSSPQQHAAGQGSGHHSHQAQTHGSHEGAGGEHSGSS